MYTRSRVASCRFLFVQSEVPARAKVLHLALGGRSTVGHGALDAVIGVRIPASQPLRSNKTSLVAARPAFRHIATRFARCEWARHSAEICVTLPRDIRATQVAAITKGSECSPPGCVARVTVSGAPVHDAGDPGHAVPRYLPNAVPSSRIKGNTIR